MDRDRQTPLPRWTGPAKFVQRPGCRDFKPVPAFAAWAVAKAQPDTAAPARRRGAVKQTAPAPDD